jgi:hypothetical protein
MKLISTHSANVVLRIPMDDVKPLGPFSPQSVLNAITNKYGLTGGPAVPQLQLGPGTAEVVPRVVLVNGTANFDGRAVGIQQIQISPDFTTLVVSVGNTDDGDLIADEILAMLDADFSFRGAKQQALRNYGSSVVVQFDRGLETYIDALTKIQDLATKVIGESLNLSQPLKIERLTFAFDPTQLPAVKGPVGGLLIERRVGQSYAENRYFSGAPVRTKDHVKLLEDIERSISK